MIKKIMLMCVSFDYRIPFQQDVEYGNTTSHLVDCDGKFQQYNMDSSGSS